MVTAEVHLCSDCGYQTDDPEVVQTGECPDCEGELVVRPND